MSMRDMRARRRWQIWADASRSPCGVWPGRRARGGHLVPEGWRHGFRGNFGGIIRSLSTADLIKSTTYGPFREAGATRRGGWTGACTCPPSPMPYQASKQGGRSRHGHTLRNGIAAPEVVVQPQRSQRHAEPLACTWKRRFRAHAPRCRCARAARHRPPAIGNLRATHDRNDEVLGRIYIGWCFRNDTERLEKLFELYTKMTESRTVARRDRLDWGAPG